MSVSSDTLVPTLDKDVDRVQLAASAWDLVRLRAKQESPHSDMLDGLGSLRDIAGLVCTGLVAAAKKAAQPDQYLRRLFLLWWLHYTTLMC